MLFIETPIFTEVVQEYLSDESYSELQQALILRPDAGNVIRGSGGLRIIYYWYVSGETFYMVFLYKKNEQEDLTHSQIKVLRRLVEEYLE